MSNSYLYYVKANNQTYEFDTMRNAYARYKLERSKGNKPELFRYKDGKMERCIIKQKCNCANCQPKVITGIRRGITKYKKIKFNGR